MHFGTGENENDAIVLADHGSGMSKDDFLDKWLVLGTTNKKNRKTTAKGRPMLGAKGVGRLAVDALGEDLLIISRTKDSHWVISYINWGLFQNPNLLLENVSIPYKHVPFINKSNINNLVEELVGAQLSNLALDGWFTSAKNKSDHKLVDYFRDYQEANRVPFVEAKRMNKYILDDQFDLFNNVFIEINNFKPNYKLLLDLIKEIEWSKDKTGTILYIASLRTNWDLTLPINEQTLSRFSKTLMWLLNNQDIESRLYCKGDDLKPFIEKDLEEIHYEEMYDIKFKGTIAMDDDGVTKFKGQLFMRGVPNKLIEPVNKILKNGLPLMDQFGQKRYSDCGSFEIEVCHVEGREFETNLNKDEWNEIQSLISRRGLEKGGIRVYIDSSRILPYGEPENDFLGIEKRRTLKAGTWIFSHRNSFGRIFLQRDLNYKLEEKTSREGFIENEYYNYLQGTCTDLLMKMARLFLKDGFELRTVSTDERSRIKKQKEALEKKQKKEREKLKKKKKEYEEIIDVFDADELLENLGYFSILNRARSISEENNIIGINSLEKELNNLKEEIVTVAKEPLIPPDSVIKYGGIKFRNKVENYNTEMEKIYKKTLKEINKLLKILDSELKKRLTSNEANIKLSKQRLKDANELLFKASQKLEINNETIENHINNFDEYVDKNKEDILKILEYDNLDEKIEVLKGRISELETVMKRGIDSNEIPSHVESLNKDLQNLQKEVEKHLDKTNMAFNKSLYSIPIDDNLSKETYDENSLIYMEQARRNDELYELANIGLTSDIMTHEFSQYIIIIRDAIRELNEYEMDEYGEHWLKVLDSGIRAVSTRLMALEPLHKSRHSHREPINLNHTLQDIIRMFEPRMKRNKITVIIDVPEDLNVITSLSRFFPVICNILDNMFYWVLLAKEKIIRIEYDNSNLFISNSGPEIRAESEHLLFSPFFSTKENGRGLGLYLSKEILKAIDWDLTLETRKDSQGLGGPKFKISVFKEDLVMNE